MATEISREQELEEENELLRQQLEAVMGSSKELGVIMSLGFGMTDRMARILFVLVKRAPAVVSRSTFHTLIYGARDDGGPEPKIFDVHIGRLRAWLKRVNAPVGVGIDTIWNAGYRANPILATWINNLYAERIKGD
jgi:DNA-binding response OmpR family regulator